jgi:riboflavin biosynthesis pyrimidine reductase
MKPDIIMLMLSSIDGGLHPSRWTESPDGERRDWSAIYETVHGELAGDGWIVGRVTIAEMSRVDAHPPKTFGKVERPVHVATSDARQFALAVDPGGKLHFAGATVGGDHVIVLLGRDVPDAHLAELAADGVSYVVSDGAELDLAAMLETVGRAFPIKRLLLEGGGTINGRFLAAGLVDEVHVLVAPAFDGHEEAESIVATPAGLAGTCRLSLRAADVIDHGVVHLRYAVTSTDG